MVGISGVSDDENLSETEDRLGLMGLVIVPSNCSLVGAVRTEDAEHAVIDSWWVVVEAPPTWWQGKTQCHVNHSNTFY